MQVDLGRIKKVELFEKNKLLLTNSFLKIVKLSSSTYSFSAVSTGVVIEFMFIERDVQSFTVCIWDIDDQFLNLNSELVL